MVWFAYSDRGACHLSQPNTAPGAHLNVSKNYPVIAVTDSSGAGTSSVKVAFEHIFHRENVRPCIIEGDSFHCFDRYQKYYNKE